MNMIWIHHNVLLTLTIVTNVITTWVELDIICTSCNHRIRMHKVSSSEMDSVWTKNILDRVPIPYLSKMVKSTFVFTQSTY
jgi:hypothetical protein